MKTNKNDENSKTINKQQYHEQRMKYMIEMIKRQTDYTDEKIKEKLKQWNYNYLFVIKEYLNPNFQKEKPKNENNNTTKNQMIYGEIRNFMDDVNKQQILRKRRTEQIEKYKSHLESVNKLKNEK